MSNIFISNDFPLFKFRKVIIKNNKTAKELKQAVY